MGAVLLHRGVERVQSLHALPFCCPIAIILPTYSDCKKFLILLHTFLNIKFARFLRGPCFLFLHFQKIFCHQCIFSTLQKGPLWRQKRNIHLPIRLLIILSSHTWGGPGPPRTARGQVTRHRARAECERSEAAWSKLASCQPVSPVPWPDRAKSQKSSITFWLHFFSKTKIANYGIEGNSTII